MTDPSSARLYAELEATLSATPAGRAFLAEHARRSRSDDTQLLLDAVARLESRVGEGRVMGDLEQLRSELAEMSAVIRRTRSDVAGMAGPEAGANRLTEAAESLDAIVGTTERATSDILDATEKIQEAAWNMREGGFDPDLCDRLDAHATDIYTACTFQDLTAQRIGRVVRSLAMLEERIVAMNRIWGDRPGSGAAPLLDGSQVVLSNDDIDFVLVGGDPPSSATAPVASEEERRREAALAELRRISELGTRDKLRLFT